MFRFKKFTIHQERCAMKVGTDGTLLGAWANGGNRILDIGTGTGLIALMMAQRYPQAQVVGVDIDSEAAKQAQENAEASPFADRIHIYCTAIQEFRQGTYDAIVSNPPFFIQSLAAPETHRNDARHTTRLSYEDLTNAACRLLSENGRFSVVVPFDYRSRMEAAAVMAGLIPSRRCEICTALHKPVKRYMLEFAKCPQPLEVTSLLIGDDSYQRLTADFYL